MTCQVFVGEDISSNYQKYRFRAPDEVRDTVLQFLDEKYINISRRQSHVLAVDLGCGTGQTTRLLAPHFQEVVGIDVSETQLEQARAVLSCPDITYRKGTAEDLPFPDGSVDLITASSAAHYFDESKFMAEANRVLKPGGCIALIDFPLQKMRLHYRDCGERLTDIFHQVSQEITDTSIPVVKSENMLEDFFSAISFPDKQRAEGILEKSTTSVRKVLGSVKTSSMFQIYKGKDAQRAEELFLDTQKRLLQEMKATSPDTEIEWTLEYYCVMASKPKQ
uniref:Methyltransferase type 11 domain-containing protein n=1 Tax=Takifugu rubripes TaxID=31033 RepID=A0A674NUE2_TAKRU